MIIAISGGIGDGKSVTAVKYACDASKHNKVITNFTLKKVKNSYRLKKSDVIESIPQEKGKPKQQVNWDFWKQQVNSDIFLDEVHNIVNSRRSMSTTNVLYSEWISQIRKIFGSTGDQTFIDTLRRMNNQTFNVFWEYFLRQSRNLTWITQKPKKADVNWRDLTHVYIRCQKQIINDAVVIINYIYFADREYDAFEMADMGQKPKVHYFIANPYFKNYDSYEIVGGDGEYL